VLGHFVIIPNVDFIYSYGIVWQQNMDEISYSGSRNYSKKKLPKRLLVFGGLFLIVLILLGSVFYFITRSGSSETPDDSATISLPAEQTEEISESPTPTNEASPTPKESITPSKTVSVSPSKAASGTTNSSDVKISVQNGSGETGVAKSAAAVLTTSGFTVVATGNADSTDYTDVTIRIKNSKKSNLAAIEKALSEKYTVGETSADLPESTSYDALVIIGK
jgi:hypothetical protein